LVAEIVGSESVNITDSVAPSVAVLPSSSAAVAVTVLMWFGSPARPLNAASKVQVNVPPTPIAVG